MAVKLEDDNLETSAKKMKEKDLEFRLKSLLQLHNEKEARKLDSVKMLIKLHEKVNPQLKLDMQTKEELLLLNNRLKPCTAHSSRHSQI